MSFPRSFRSSPPLFQVEYKEYGTNMTFTPEILEGGIVRLKLKAEVSAIDKSTTVTAAGISVPGTTKRAQRTVVELRENETLVIGGILTQSVSRHHQKTPFFSDIPLLGRLFTEDDITQNDIELLIVITPHIVHAMSLDEKKDFYDAKAVESATRTLAPPHPNEIGNTIDGLIVQKEPREQTKSEFKSWWNEKSSADQFAETVAQRFEEKKPESERSWGWKSQPSRTEIARPT